MRVTRAIAGLRRAVSWHRRKLAVLAAVVAVIAGVNAAHPPSPPTVTVVVATQALAGGARLQPADLARRRLPPAAVPVGSVSEMTDLIGRTLVAPVTKGTVFTIPSVLGPRLPRADPGNVIAPVTLADAALVSLLAVGDRVDILATSTDPGQSAPRASVIAAGARLVTIPAPADTGRLGSPSRSGSAVVLVEVDSATAARLAQAAATGPLTVVLR